MSYIFNGREFAAKKEVLLRQKVAELKKKIKSAPRLVSLIIGSDPASILYQELKKKAGERIGAHVDIKILDRTTKVAELKELIFELNADQNVNGIMVQLPLPSSFSDINRDEVINSISRDKDVDGLRKDSKFTPPTAKAVLEIFEESQDYQRIKGYPGLILVVGGTGFIGSQIFRAFEKQKLGSYNIRSLNSKNFSKETLLNADVIISVTGREKLIKADMVKEGAVLIDVGAPLGDIEKDAYEKASFVSPVPGGVGPITIICLLENLVLASN